MIFCCAEKAFKLLAQNCDQIWRKIWRCFVRKRYATSEIDCHCFTAKLSLFTAKLSSFLPPKRPVENRDFVDFAPNFSHFSKSVATRCMFECWRGPKSSLWVLQAGGPWKLGRCAEAKTCTACLGHRVGSLLLTGGSATGYSGGPGLLSLTGRQCCSLGTTSPSASCPSGRPVEWETG